MDIERLKWNALENLTREDSADLKCGITLDHHGIVLRWQVDDENFLKELQAYFPKVQQVDSTPAHTIQWFNPSHYPYVNDSFWHNDPNSECRWHHSGVETRVIQRDFLAFEKDNITRLVTPYWIDDGLFNFLRWFLPKRMLFSDAFLMHSSAVIDDSGNAHLCLGHSGAGKTTIATMAPKERVLGDDMNVVVKRGGRWFVTPAIMGQALDNPVLYGQYFPIKKVFWLKKGKGTALSRLTPANSLLKVLSQMANLFWEEMPAELVEKANRFACDFSQSFEVSELTFNLDGGVWNDIFEL